jgi:hypothetical protein
MIKNSIKNRIDKNFWYFKNFYNIFV